MTHREIRFPEPYPDENCYSILCRYAVRSGWVSSNQVSVILYGNTMPLAGLLYKPFRNRDIDRWAGMEKQEVRYGETHSCLQYFTAFLEQGDAGLLRQCHTGMALSPGLTKRITMKCSLTQIRKKHLWYCPVCAVEDFRMYGETYWRRLPQMPGVSYCARHKVRLCESGLPVSDINYRIFPASYVLLHIPDAGTDCRGNVFEEEFIHVAKDTGWLLKHGFEIPDNTSLRALFYEKAGRELDEHVVYPGGTGGEIRFEHYLATRFLKESGRKNVGLAPQKYLSTILSIERCFGSFENFWRS